MASADLPSLRRRQAQLLRMLAEREDLDERCALEGTNASDLREALRAGARALLPASDRQQPGAAVGELILRIDGASRGNPGPAGIGVVVSAPSGETIEEIAEYIGITTNNEAEYRALLIGLQEGVRRGAKRLHVFSDSQLLAFQMQGRYRVRREHLAQLHREAQWLVSHFEKFEIVHVDRQENRAADSLANEAIDGALKEGRWSPAPGEAPEESPSSTEQGAG